jgi:spermidine/putrescine transport system permease protein
MAGLISLPLMVPKVVTAVASLAVVAAIGLTLDYLAIILAYTVSGIPFAYFPIAARLPILPNSLDVAARDLYASLDDSVITSFLTGGTATLPVAPYGLARTSFTPEIDAMATLMLALSVAIVMLSLLTHRKRRR